MARGKSKEKASILERQLLALDMRKSGYSFRKIAERLKVSYQTAYRDVSAELSRMSELRDGKKEELRQLELERLDALTEALNPMASVGNPSSVSMSVKVMERRAKLLGLDMPLEVELGLKRETLLELKAKADAAGVDLAATFEALINELGSITVGDRQEES